MTFEEYKEIEPLYDEAVEFAKANESMSISKMQRRFLIGYNRAARLLEQLAEQKMLDYNNMTGAYRRARNVEAGQ